MHSKSSIAIVSSPFSIVWVLLGPRCLRAPTVDVVFDRLFSFPTIQSFEEGRVRLSADAGWWSLLVDLRVKFGLAPGVGVANLAIPHAETLPYSFDVYLTPSGPGRVESGSGSTIERQPAIGAWRSYDVIDGLRVSESICCHAVGFTQVGFAGTTT
jgi:hypothetical protein